jgi:hypothetical protein
MSDRREDYEREMRNEEATEKLTSAAFRRSDIEAMNQTDHDYTGSEEQTFIYTAVDPSAGGLQSRTACVSIITPVVYDARLKIQRQDVVVRVASFLLLLFFPLFLDQWGL